MVTSDPNNNRNTFLDGSTTKFPSRQLFILALCRICEPIAFMSIFPYVYHMVLSFDVTLNEHQTAVYVGMVTSAFAFAEFSTGVVWGRISDRIGRKPVLLAGLAGTALSMIIFGFARSFPVALLARALGGFLNGNQGVLQTTVAELVTVKDHQPRAFSIMPFVWCLGSVIGPAMGGALAQPAKNLPEVFSPGTVFAKYPFLLPNLVCTAVLAIGLMVGVLFLEETHPQKKDKKDLGLEAGKWILHFCTRARSKAIRTTHMAEKTHNGSDSVSPLLLDDEELPEYSLSDGPELPGYRTKDVTPRQSSSRSHSPNARVVTGTSSVTSKNRGAHKAFNKQVILAISAFGILAYHSISFDQLMPVFLSEPVSRGPVDLPFFFNGGFGYPTKKIGFMLAIQGVYSMIAQLLIFPFVARTFGTVNTFRSAILLWSFLYFLVPYTVLLPEVLHVPAVYFILLAKITFHVLAFPSTAIMVANAAPSTLVLGVVNGVSASTASLARAFGPTVTGVIHSWGLSIGSNGLAWWVNGIICVIGLIESAWLEDNNDHRQPGDVTREEPASTEALLDPAALEAAISAVEDEGELCHQLHKSDSKIQCDELMPQ